MKKAQIFSAYFFSNKLHRIQFDIFLLGYNKVDKKQKFSAFEMVESLSQEMWFLSYVSLMIDSFLFLDSETQEYYFYFAGRSEIILPTARKKN